MTAQEFLTLPFGSKVYNTKERIFAITSTTIGYKNPEEISNAIAEILKGGPKIYSITLEEVKEILPNRRIITHINNGNYQDWIKLNSIAEMPDQELINKILMEQIEALKTALRTPTEIENISINGSPVRTKMIQGLPSWDLLS